MDKSEVYENVASIKMREVVGRVYIYITDTSGDTWSYVVVGAVKADYQGEMRVSATVQDWTPYAIRLNE